MTASAAATLAPVTGPTYDKQIAFRLTSEDFAWLDAEARRRRRETGELVTPSDVLRDLIREARAREAQSKRRR